MGDEINELEDLPGVGEATAEKLRDGGYTDLESIAVANKGDLMEKGDVGKKTATKIIKAARDSMDMGYETAKELLKKREKVGRISTGSEDFDNLLGGGVETQSITELYGKFSSGKTQVSLQLAVNSQKPKEEGGIGKNCLYIDNEKTFRPERVISIAEDQGLDPDEVLENIQVAQAYSADHQMLLVEEAGELIKEKDIGLIIVDSLTGRFRSEYVGRGTLANRQQQLNRHMHKLQEWSNLHNLAVVVTNQVMSNPGLMFGDPTRPIGGNIVGHQSTTRIYLRKSKQNKRIARLVDSPSQPEGEAVFKITNEGIKDA